MTLFISRKRYGFTLTEMAIALGIAGVVMASIWEGAHIVWFNYHINRTHEEISQASQSFRNYYGFRIQVWPSIAAQTDITGIVDANNIMPIEMRRNPALGPGGSVLDHDLNHSIAGGSFKVFAQSEPAAPNTFNAFRFALYGLDSLSCSTLLLRMPLSSDTIGFVRVGTQNMGNSMTIAKGKSGGAPAQIALATAQAWCANAGNTNEVDLDFSIQN